MAQSKSKKGKFRPKNPSKYKGNLDHIIWRSTWELRVFHLLDNDANVLEWASEPVIIPYADRLSGRLRRYIPDLLVKMRDRDGKIETVLIEIKPGHESPFHSRLERGQKSEKRFLREAVVWNRNKDKWEAAVRWAAKRDIRFKVLTERELGLSF